MRLLKLFPKSVYAIPIIAFIGFVAVFGLMSLNGFIKVAGVKVSGGTRNLKNISVAYTVKHLQDTFFRKYDFINLAGVVANTLGINSFNTVQKFASGYLSDFEYGVIDTKPQAKKVAQLASYLKGRSIPFLYVLAPSKASIYDVQFSPGYEDGSYKNIASMIGHLKDSNVNYLNMDEIFKENGWTTPKVFPRTDNHWLPEAQMFATKKIMENYRIQTGQDVPELDKLDESAYEKHILKNEYLGIWGNRTGIHYGGIDDISIFIPKFPMDVQFSAFSSADGKWTHRKSLLKDDPLQLRPLFLFNPYATYMPGPNSIQVVKNKDAKLKKKVMVIGDSFSQIVRYFLPTQFEEVHFIHLLNHKEGSLAQYLGEHNFDFVVMVTNERQFPDGYYSYGLDEYLKTKANSKDVKGKQTVTNVELKSKPNNNRMLFDLPLRLAPGKTYTLDISNTALEGSKEPFIQMELYNLTNNRPVSNRFFWSNETKPQKWIFTVPKNENDAFTVLLYAGLKGRTNGIKINIPKITLREGIHEDVMTG